MKLPYINKIHSGRVFTKHYVNASNMLHPGELSVFNFLCFETTGDNTFLYSTILLKKYRAYVRALVKNYNWDLEHLPISLDYTRASIRWLIDNGFIYRTEYSKQYFISPVYSYRPKWFLEAYYKEWYDGYLKSESAEEMMAINMKVINKIRDNQKKYKKK